jgi:hypothetical protein
MWGWIGGILGAAVGVGSAAVAIFVEGANAYQSSPYPPFFVKRQLLAYDVCVAVFVAVGAAVGALIMARRGCFPRTDAMDGTRAGRSSAHRLRAHLHEAHRRDPRVVISATRIPACVDSSVSGSST